MGQVNYFDWFIGLPVSAVIGQSDYFGFGFTTLILETALISNSQRMIKVNWVYERVVKSVLLNSRDKFV